MVKVRQLAKLRMVAVNDRGLRIGESHPRSVLTDAEVDLLLELRDAGLTLGVLAAKFDVSKGCVAKIVSGQRRGQVAAEWRALGAKRRR